MCTSSLVSEHAISCTINSLLVALAMHFYPGRESMGDSVLFWPIFSSEGCILKISENRNVMLVPGSTEVFQVTNPMNRLNDIMIKI